MYEITYCSTASPELSARDIPIILEQARGFNLKSNITGCLLYHNRRFVQLLEGDREIVQALYSKISQDSRHSDVLLLAKGDKEERVFPSWSMAYHELSNGKGPDEELFVDNFMRFSDLAEKSTFPTLLFWGTVRRLLEN